MPAHSTTDDRLTRLETQLRELGDREAIRNLIARYGPLADTGNAEGLAALWSEDGVYDVGGYGEHRGQAAIAALFTADTHLGLMRDGCAHLLGPLHISLHNDHAVAVGHSCVFRRTSSGFEAWRVSANRWELAKQDGAWCVTRRVNRLLDGSEAARAVLAPER